MEPQDSDRLNSWKEIGSFIDRDERTAMRWAKLHGMPVHHSPGGSHARVYAYRSEVSAWVQLQDHAIAAEAHSSPATSGHNGPPSRPLPEQSAPNLIVAAAISSTQVVPKEPELFAFLGERRWMVILGLGLFAVLLLLGEIFVLR
jgi:hypothetical protein